ncbi:MAG TPA: hypothetical protein VF747_17300 [Blastocatellia bacterium]|jgi:hypothetical protein
MPAAIAGPLIGLGSSIVGGILGKKKTETATSTSNSTSAPIFSPYQLDLQKTLTRYLRKGIKSGGEPTQDEKNQAYTGVNNTFDALLKRLESNAVSRGFGESGKFNLNMQGLEVERAKERQNATADLRSEALKRQLAMLGIASGTAFASPGQTTTGTGTGTAPGQSTGQAIGGAIAGAGQDFGSWLLLQDLLKKQKP